MEVVSAERGYPNWASLPEDILALIQSKLYVFDDCNNFDDVCKSWRSVYKIVDPGYSIGFGSQFIVERIKGSRLNFRHPFGQHYYMDIEELRGASIRFAKNGWMLVSKGHYRIFFFHPISKSKIKLPKLTIRNSFDSIGFSSNPTSYDCTVFGIRKNSGWYDICIISHGEKEWRVIRIEGIKNMLPAYTNPIYLEGKFYYLFNFGKVFVFDPKGFEWEVMDPLGKPLTIDDKCDLEESYLLDFNGEIVFVYIAQMGSTISILRLDESKPISKWECINDLGEYMFLLSETTSFATKCVNKHMQNKIYFPRFYGRYGVFFCMEQKSYQNFAKNFDRKDLNNVPHKPLCSWIEPTKKQSSTMVPEWCDNGTNFDEEEDDDTNDFLTR